MFFIVMIHQALAYRVPSMEQVRVFEVDQPRTLVVKQKKLKKMLRILPKRVTFVETDLNVHKLERTLV
ncbi:Leucine carboxyl methyltransferase [Thermoflavimicrobium dichotomicum]|uniref:Leucine carboxyl methyltransferase n=1 Tax=Thermoflavimicrobium dichotomicum TaxID=46223 RepID=A0A1I3SQF2_9BACL|nr:Leucine carboxyl methyltransferase [Thermoflavimicrobium dichotomicum]